MIVFIILIGLLLLLLYFCQVQKMKIEGERCPNKAYGIREGILMRRISFVGSSVLFLY